MAVYEVTTNKGKYQVETNGNQPSQTSSDSSDSSDIDMSNMFGQNQPINQPSVQQPQQLQPQLTPQQNQDTVEQTIAQRPTAFGPNSQYDWKNHPALSALKAISAPFQVAEAIPADVALAAQRANAGGFQKLGQNLAQDISGNRVPQMGDVFRASGVPGLNSEPVASTLGLVSAVGVPGVNAGTKAIGGAISNAISPATDIISSAASKFGKPAVANALSMITTKPAHIWESLIDNPDYGDAKYVKNLSNNAKQLMQEVVNPLQEDVSNRVALTPEMQSQLHDVGLFVKPQGVDGVTMTQAVSGDAQAAQKVMSQQSIDNLQKIVSDPNTSSQAKMRALGELGANFGSGKSTGELKFGEIPQTRPVTPQLEPSAALQGLSGSQRNKLMSWYQKLSSTNDMSFNQARGITADIDNNIKNYWDKVQAKGQGINGAQAGQFERMATGLRNVVTQAIGQQYPEAAKALEQYGIAKNAENVYRTTTTLEPHMFRAFFVRMGLAMSGAGPAAYPAAAMASVPAMNVGAIRGLNKLGGVISKYPSSILSPLTRGVGNTLNGQSNTQGG